MRLPADLDPDGPDLTIPEFAARTEQSERTIRRHISEGQLPGAHRIGRWRIPQQTAIDYISLRTIRPKSTNSPE
jgi:predicted DNA-binding transcriptional regulator AlpA